MADWSWLKHYPEGVPPTISDRQPRSLVEIFEQSCQRYAAHQAFVCLGTSISYAQLDLRSKELAAYFQKVLGLKKGDRIGLMMPNILQYPIAMLAALRAGLIVTNINPLYTARELEHQLKDSGAKAIVIVANFAHVLSEIAARTPLKHVIVTEVGDQLGFLKSVAVNFVLKHIKKQVPPYRLKNSVAFNDALAIGKQHSLSSTEVHSEDIAFLQYTGGTTGVSKGAILTHANMVANVSQARTWIGNLLEPGREIVVTALPLYHIFSLTANCMVFVSLGGLNILIPNPRDLKAFVKAIARYPFTAFTGVNTLFNALANFEDFQRLNFSSLKFSLGGGAAVQQKVAQDWKKLTGKTICQAYGLTEASPAVTINPLAYQEFNGSIGMPLPSTLVTVRDDDGKLLEVGSIGELWVKGPQVMVGYWHNPQETAKCLTAEGWLRTGDIGKEGEGGLFYVVDRKKDMIIVSGFNVFPNEIEDVAAMHPGVLESAAIGVQDAHSGEAVKIFVVKKDKDLTADQLKEHFRANLTPYKVPKFIEFRASLPKSNVGKILRRELR